MTVSAAFRRPGLTGCVLGMIELRIEASQGREFLEWWVLLVERTGLVTDRAERAVRSSELGLMTAYTIFMLWEARLQRVGPRMANGTTPASAQRCMRAR